MVEHVLQTLRHLGDSFDEAELRLYLKDPWIVGAPRIIDKYLHGDCDKFAQTLHLRMGWPMYAVFEERALTGNKGLYVGQGLVHAFVSTNHCLTIVDVKGERSFTNILEEYALPSYTSAISFNGLDA